jgi:hypothetical protein
MCCSFPVFNSALLCFCVTSLYRLKAWMRMSDGRHALSDFHSNLTIGSSSSGSSSSDNTVLQFQQSVASGSRATPTAIAAGTYYFEYIYILLHYMLLLCIYYVYTVYRMSGLCMCTVAQCTPPFECQPCSMRSVPAVSAQCDVPV